MFIDINQKFNKVHGKCDRALTSSDDTVHLIICCREDMVRQNCQGDPPFESQGSERTSVHSNLLREEFSCSWIQTYSGTWSMVYV